MPLSNFPEGYQTWRAWDMGARQRASQFWRDYISRDPELSRAFVTVEIRFGSRVVRLARQTLTTVSTSTGERQNYLPGLNSEPEVRQSISLGNQSASARSVRIEIPGFIVKPNDLLADGYILAGVGEVALQVDGGDYDLRFVLLRGSVSGGVSFGEEGETVQVSITDLRDLQGVKLPEWIIDSTSWPNAQEAAVGMRIPRVYNGCVAMPVPRVLDDHGGTGLYFAMNDTPDDFDVSAVYVNGEAKASGDASYPWTETTVADGYGRRTHVLDCSGWSAAADNDAVNVTLTRSSGTDPRGVIEIARELLANYSGLGLLGLNLDLFSFAETRVDPTEPEVVINASGSDAAGALDFVEGGLLDNYPMLSLLYSGAGLGLTLIERRLSNRQDSTTGNLVGGRWPLYERVSSYTESPKSSLFTDYEVRYSINPMERGYGKVLTRDPTTSPACALAERSIGGRRPYGAIESPYITSDAEAAYVIDWLVAHRSIPYYSVEWSCSPSMMFRFRLGENVRYTDPDFSSFTSCIATIVGFSFRRGECSVEFCVWHPQLALSLAAKV